MDVEYWHEFWWFMWLLPVLILIVFALVLFRWRTHRTAEHGASPGSARQILDRRYAKGELSLREYEEMKQALQR